MPTSSLTNANALLQGYIRRSWKKEAPTIQPLQLTSYANPEDAAWDVYLEIFSEAWESFANSLSKGLLIGILGELESGKLNSFGTGDVWSDLHMYFWDENWEYAKRLMIPYIRSLLEE